MPALAACPKDFTGKNSFGIDVCAHTDIEVLADFPDDLSGSTAVFMLLMSDGEGGQELWDELSGQFGIKAVAADTQADEKRVLEEALSEASRRIRARARKAVDG